MTKIPKELFDDALAANNEILAAINAKDDNLVYSLIKKGAPYSLHGLSLSHNIDIHIFFSIREGKAFEFEKVFEPFYNWSNKNPDALSDIYFYSHFTTHFKMQFWKTKKLETIMYYHNNFTDRFNALEGLNSYCIHGLEGAIKNKDKKVWDFWFNHPLTEKSIEQVINNESEYSNFLYNILYLHKSKFIQVFNKIEQLTSKDNIKTKLLMSLDNFINHNKDYSSSKINNFINNFEHIKNYYGLFPHQTIHEYFIKNACSKIGKNNSDDLYYKEKIKFITQFCYLYLDENIKNVDKLIKLGVPKLIMKQLSPYILANKLDHHLLNKSFNQKKIKI